MPAVTKESDMTLFLQVALCRWYRRKFHQHLITLSPHAHETKYSPHTRVHWPSLGWYDHGKLVAAVGTINLANGDANFQATGPTRYWYYDANEGYCSSRTNRIYNQQCQPRNAQWTYTSPMYNEVNGAV